MTTTTKRIYDTNDGTMTFHHYTYFNDGMCVATARKSYFLPSMKNKNTEVIVNHKVVHDGDELTELQMLSLVEKHL